MKNSIRAKSQIAVATLKKDFDPDNGTSILKKGSKVWTQKGLRSEGSDALGNQTVSPYFPTPSKKEWGRHLKVAEDYDIFNCKEYHFLQVPRSALHWN